MLLFHHLSSSAPGRVGLAVRAMSRQVHGGAGLGREHSWSWGATSEAVREQRSHLKRGFVQRPQPRRAA